MIIASQFLRGRRWAQFSWSSCWCSFWWQQSPCRSELHLSPGWHRGSLLKVTLMVVDRAQVPADSCWRHYFLAMWVTPFSNHMPWQFAPGDVWHKRKCPRWQPQSVYSNLRPVILPCCICYKWTLRFGPHRWSGTHKENTRWCQTGGGSNLTSTTCLLGDIGQGMWPARYSHI
jgi:hypothetical protein